MQATYTNGYIPKRNVKFYFSVNMNFNTKRSLKRNAGWRADKCFFQISNHICPNDHNIRSFIDDHMAGNYILMTHNIKPIIVATHPRNSKHIQMRLFNF